MIDTTVFEQGVEQVARRAARDLTAELRRSAVQQGWPGRVARALTVEYDPGTGDFAVRYPPEAAREVEDLEYGDQSSAPSPVLRRFHNSHGVGAGI